MVCAARRRKALISFDANERRLKLTYLEAGDGWRLRMEVLGLQGPSWTKGLPAPLRMPPPCPGGVSWALRRKVPPCACPRGRFPLNPD